MVLLASSLSELRNSITIIGQGVSVRHKYIVKISLIKILTVDLQRIKFHFSMIHIALRMVRILIIPKYSSKDTKVWQHAVARNGQW